jgi:hypothetical protein
MVRCAAERSHQDMHRHRAWRSWAMLGMDCGQDKRVWRGTGRWSITTRTPCRLQCACGSSAKDIGDRPSVPQPWLREPCTSGTCTRSHKQRAQRINVGQTCTSDSLLTWACVLVRQYVHQDSWTQDRTVLPRMHEGARPTALCPQERRWNVTHKLCAPFPWFRR